ncbi:ABC transporter substrate-binding protein [Paraburkholderia caballeronis]|uniref:Amino acid ABC transporter substrate-binding protein, PAAT family n=1 Tax=Paraburkholderia caballeronis TaxID=416943 RepID=A0A1H7SW40_9BURK|nr:ABC transporter substrate-binding protein [Paraburkholderia caballeronis]PXW25698.1 amino acid ABC transporter substrate-binding protein (PAAT family) [Paraburkholderia caballeronis]PXX01305.1 amino acid ABC transporter substrate-binding protein (PAAT family) [Paraburkholderia caballeronis]RAJ99342.1 amino acid ABC transporter substrate-binding protein (PAAT family) [Paraburkholderia caballeronis]TDV05508.1 amino acid ABC transporter substrate-binding protein (PAAT family) [Paraburkholderia 
MDKKISKGRQWIVSALVAAAGFAAAGASADPAPTLTPGTLKVGMQATYPPFEYYDGDKIEGADPELARAIAKQLGGSAAFVDTPLPQLILGLNASRFDIIMSAMYVTPERASQATPIPYAQTGSAIMVAASTGLKPRTMQDLCGMHLGIVQGTAWVGQLHDVSDHYCTPNGKPPIVVSEFGSTSYVLQAMLSNNVQAGMQVAATAKALADKSGGRVVVTSTDLINPQTIGIFVRKDNKPLHDAVVRALAELKKSGEYDTLLQRYGLKPPPAASAS